tara:strand:+ start:6086 stop:6331 length:246 start_codon:yes stop_codon:yes gene_type:complete
MRTLLFEVENPSQKSEGSIMTIEEFILNLAWGKHDISPLVQDLIQQILHRMKNEFNLTDDDAIRMLYESLERLSIFVKEWA